MEVQMTITAEQKQAIERAGSEPVRVEDPETKTRYLIIREDVYRKMRGLVRVDPPGPDDEHGEFHGDKSLYEYGEFRPKK